MRIVSRKTLSEYWLKHENVEDALLAWFAEASSAKWKTPAEIKKRYPSGDPVGINRFVFNIKGDHYRLVVKIHYNTSIIYIRFIGTHAEYDQINAEKI